MDYKKLIERGRSWRNNHHRQELNEPCCIIAEMTTAIETLLEEREAAVSALKKFCDDTGDGCELCKHMPCTEKYGHCIGWEWRGPRKEM